MNLLLRDTKFGFTKFSQCCAKGGGGGTCTTIINNNTWTYWQEVADGPVCPSAEDIVPTSRDTLQNQFPILSQVVSCFINVSCSVEKSCQIISCELDEPDLMDPFSNNTATTSNSGTCSCGNSCNCTCNTTTTTVTDVKPVQNDGGVITKTLSAKVKYKIKLTAIGQDLGFTPTACNTAGVMPGGESGSLALCNILVDFANAIQPEQEVTVNVEYTVQGKKQRIITVYTTTTNCG
jgi:hypothetical protein